MTTEEQIKEKYSQFQYLQQQMEQINEHLQLLNQNVAELDISINAIKEIGKTKIDEEILAPVANGIFIKAQLKDNQKLVVNVGSNVTVEKNPAQVVELLEEQKKQLAERIVEAEEVIGQINEQAMKIYQEVEKLSE